MQQIVELPSYHRMSGAPKHGRREASNMPKRERDLGRRHREPLCPFAGDQFDSRHKDVLLLFKKGNNEGRTKFGKREIWKIWERITVRFTRGGH